MRIKWRSLLSTAAIIFLILFALIETVPFVLTIANSFKCLPATRQASEAFIPGRSTAGLLEESGLWQRARATSLTPPQRCLRFPSM